jgi:uncharacterized protein
MIIDAHAHLGQDEVFDEDFTAEQLLTSQSDSEIALTLVQPSLVHDLETAQAYHDRIADLARAHPGRFSGIANPNPHLPGRQYEAEVRRCVEQLGFVGVKLHPMAHAVNPLGRAGRRVFALASELGLPVMVHTGVGGSWSDPTLLSAPAAEYPHLSIVVAHAGGSAFAAEAGLLAERFDNVFLECSWAAGFAVRHWAQSLGAERLMFGSDHADNAATELFKIRHLGLPPDAQADLLGDTAERVFLAGGKA